MSKRDHNDGPILSPQSPARHIGSTDEAKVSGDPPMHRHIFAVLAAIPFAIAIGTKAADADIKKAPYPEVKMKLLNPYKGDDAFMAMRKAFSDAVANKDSSALFGLVGPI